jgi:hypothetical protein
MTGLKLKENLSFVLWQRDEGEVELAVHEDLIHYFLNYFGYT